MTYYLFIFHKPNPHSTYEFAETESVEQAQTAIIQNIHKVYTPAAAQEIIDCLDGSDVYEIPPKQYLTYDQYKASMESLTAYTAPFFDDLQLTVLHDFCEWAANRGLTHAAVIGIAYMTQQGVELGLPLVVRGLPSQT